MSESPQDIAKQIVARHRGRVAAKDAQAELKLVMEITLAVSDARAGTESARPEDVPTPPPPPSAQEVASRKVLEGKPLSGQDEDAIIFGNM
jgi:hypothetical protein